MTADRYFVDGRRVDHAGFTVSGTDPGLLIGLNVFETCRTYNGHLFRGLAHARRLSHSAEVLAVPCPPIDIILAELYAGAASADDGEDVSVRMTLTMGGRRLCRVVPLDRSLVGAPLRVVTRHWEPSPWLNGRIKHGSRALGEVARRAAKVDEVLWVGADGCLTEGARSSVFAVIDAAVVTPPDDGRILTGITRSALLEAAASAGIPCREAPLPLGAPMTELYASSTLKELAPIVTLDGAPAPGSGPIGAALYGAFHTLIERETL